MISRLFRAHDADVLRLDRAAVGKLFSIVAAVLSVLTLSLAEKTTAAAGFIKEPSPSIAIVPSGDEVTYHCQHNETEAHIGWWINGESLGSSGMQGFDPQQTSPSGSGSNLHSLHINTSAIDTTLQVFTIQCTLTFNQSRVSTDNITLVLIYPESNAITEPGELVTTNIIKENNSSSVQVEVFILLKYLHNIPRRSTGMFSLSLYSADDQLQEQKHREFGFMRPTFEHHHSGLVMVLKLNHSLPSHRVWNCILLEHNDTSEANVTTNFINKHFELSTHDIQNISISLINSTTPNAIKISADIINGSQSKGFLAIAQSAVDIHFVVALRQNDENTITTNITDIIGREYNIAVYTIEKNGLPFLRPASKPQKLNSSDKGDENASLTPITISECVGNARGQFSESDSKKLVVVVANLSNSQNIYVNFSDNITDKDLHKQYAAIFHFADGFISGNPNTCTSSHNGIDVNQNRPDLIIEFVAVIMTVLVLLLLLVAGLVRVGCWCHGHRGTLTIKSKDAIHDLESTTEQCLDHDGSGSQSTTVQRLDHDGSGSQSTTDQRLDHDGSGFQSTTDQRLDHDGSGSQSTTNQRLDHDGSGSQSTTDQHLDHDGSGSQSTTDQHLDHDGSGSQSTTDQHLDHDGSGSQSTTDQHLDHDGSGSQSTTDQRLDHDGSGFQSTTFQRVDHDGSGSESTTDQRLDHDGSGSQSTAVQRVDHDGSRSQSTTFQRVDHDGSGSQSSTYQRVDHDGSGSQTTTYQIVERDGPSQPRQQNNSLRFRGTGKDRHKS